MNKQSGFTGVVLFFVAVIAIVGAIWWGVSAHHSWIERTTATVEFTVKEKECVMDDSANSNKYLIFTENEVFENTDSYYHNKFDSSDLQGYLEVGKKYKCEVFGERNPRWSWYRNLTACEKLN